MSSSADARSSHASPDRDDFIVIPVSGGAPHHALDQLERQLRRFAFDLHDGPLQSCAMAETILGRAESTSEVDELRAQAAAAEGLIANARLEMRRIMRHLKPEALDTEGVEARITEFAEDFTTAHGIAVHVNSEGDEVEFSPRSQVALLRIVQESLTNARRHSDARELDIDISFAADGVTCSVADDGHGFRLEDVLGSDASAHSGLRNMAERAALVGGYVSVATAPGTGTVIRTWIPASSPWV